MKPKTRIRWWIIGTLFLSTTINYIDRQTLSVLSPVILKELNLTHVDYSKIVSAFQVTYAITWLVGGVFLDVVGTRLGLALAVCWFSVASMLTGLANSVRSFAAFRFLLGIGEGCNWPGANKAVAEWFPARERGMAVAIFDSGSSVGGIVAALLVPWVAILLGWRYAFLVAGTLGFLWLLLWLSVYHPLKRHPRVSEEERELIESGREMATTSAQTGIERWLNLLRHRNVWGIVLGRSFTDPIWWFYVFWLPQYLSDERGFSLKQIAAFAWIPFVASTLGNYTGGVVSGYLIRRGMPAIRARKWVCVVSSLPILAGIPAALTENAYWALALICVATWGYATWSTMGLTFPSDLFPSDVVASVTGLSGLGAGLAGTLFTLAVGSLVDKFHSYFLAFLAAGLVPLLATAAVLILIRAPRTA
ncbi:MAG: MFS transporter [Acidobacteria bacterium]|nr:MFS transporter [Acidobacteriota bacterium]